MLAAHDAAATKAPVTYFGYVSGSAEVPPNASAATSNAAFVAANSATAAGAEAAPAYGLARELTYFNIDAATLPGGEIRSTLHPDAIFRNGMASS